MLIVFVSQFCSEQNKCIWCYCDVVRTVYSVHHATHAQNNFVNSCVSLASILNDLKMWMKLEFSWKFFHIYSIDIALDIE